MSSRLPLTLSLLPQVPPGATVLYTVELKDWNAIYDVNRDGGIVVKCLGQLDTYGPLCDDAAQVKLTIEGKLMPSGEVFMQPTDKEVGVSMRVLPPSRDLNAFLKLVRVSAVFGAGRDCLRSMEMSA